MKIQIDVELINALFRYIDIQSVFLTDDHAVEMEEECADIVEEYQEAATEIMKVMAMASVKPGA